MIDKIEIDVHSSEFPHYLKDVELFKHPIEFKEGLNLVIGRNQSGKTSLLRFLANKYPCVKIHGSFSTIEKNQHGGIKFNFFDRNKGFAEVTSHGEFMMHTINSFQGDLDGDVTIWDEPDRGVDLSYLQIVKMFVLRYVKHNKQVILSTNSLYTYFMLKDYASNIIELDSEAKKEFEEKGKEIAKSVFQKEILSIHNRIQDLTRIIGELEIIIGEFSKINNRIE